LLHQQPHEVGLLLAGRGRQVGRQAGQHPPVLIEHHQLVAVRQLRQGGLRLGPRRAVLVVGDVTPLMLLPQLRDSRLQPLPLAVDEAVSYQRDDSIR
jgi:hypothetical protein